MKVEIGMYVRTKKGHIDKIIKIDNRHHRTIKVECGEEEYCMGCWEFTDWFAPEHYIKASHNIIGIIQSKDLIIDTKNNLYVVDRVEGDYVFTTSKNEYGLIITLVDYQIKSIVTKEQFAAMQYEVK